MPPARPVDRVRLQALRYAVNEEAAAYVAIMRLFTQGLSGLMSDLSADEVRDRLVAHGLDLDLDTVDERLGYLVEHGNLARSPRETEARTIRDYLRNRSRYQVTQRGDLVHRQVEELLGHTESVREVSSEMLGGILEGLVRLSELAPTDLDRVDPDDLAGRIATVFAQFGELVASTREFYTYLTHVLTRFDLDRGELQAFKAALLEYLQRFVAEVDRHMPQLADVLRRVGPQVPALCARAGSGARLVDVDGRAARRARGLDPGDWEGLTAWFTGRQGRESDATGVRHLATDAMRALLHNLRRIAASSENEQSRYGDLLRVARWFDTADDDTAHALAAAVFALYPCRHLGFATPSDPAVPATTSWWDAPPADVPVMLRTQGDRKVAGRSGARVDHSATKAVRLAERAREEDRARACVEELGDLAGPGGARDLEQVRMSDDARRLLLDLYSRGLASGPTSEQNPTMLGRGTGHAAGLSLRITATPGRHCRIASPAGELTAHDRTLRLLRTAATRDERREGIS